MKKIITILALTLCLYGKAQTDSIHKTYYKSGKLKFETPYANGKKNGVEKGYYEKSGNLKTETPLKDGKLDGVGKWYDENGKLKK